MFFYSDIYDKDGKIINLPLALQQMDTSKSPRYKGNKKQFIDHMNSNKTLYEDKTATSIYKGMTFIDPSNSVSELDFVIQQKQLQALNDSLNQTRSAGKTPKTRLIGFDFETLGMDVSRPYAINSYAAITELGITESIVGKTSINHTGYSIAGGITEKQLVQYLTDFKKFKDEGLQAFGNNQEMIASLMNRLSVYGQSDINDLYQIKHIANLGDVVTINSEFAAAGKTFDLMSIEKGIMHVSALGGISKETFENALLEAKLISSSNNNQSYSRVLENFERAGLKKQVIAKDTEIANNIIGYFSTMLSKENTFINNFNGNIFDLNVFHNFIGDVLNKENTIDTLTAFKNISGNQDVVLGMQIATESGIPRGIKRITSQEGMAQAHGISTGVAHNAGFDSRVANELLGKKDFYNGKSLPQLASEFKPSYVQGISESKKVYYALNSVVFDKNGSDYLEDASILNYYGIQRGKYYYIDDIKQYKDGRIATKFVSATNGKAFIKVTETLEDLEKIIKEDFLVDNDSKKGNEFGQQLKTLNNTISDADRARRNYESLFSTNNIEKLNNKPTGGYEKLNQYYKAYQISSEKIGEINSDVINQIANGEKDDVIIDSLKQVGLEHESSIRDFKLMYGRIHDESGVIDYITDTLNDTELNIHQKTLAAKKMRDNIIQYAENEYQHITDKDYSKAARRDLFDVDIYMKGASNDPTRINFETSKAVDLLTINFYNNSESKNAISVANSMMDSVVELHQRGIVNTKFLEDFYHAAGIEHTEALGIIKRTLEDNNTPKDEIDKITSKFVIRPTSEIQPRKLAEILTSYIQNTYVKRIKSGYSYSKFVNSDGDFSTLNNERLINFMEHKTKELSGNISLNKALGHKYINTNTKEILTLDDVFINMDGQMIEDNTKEIIDSVSKINTVFNPDEIKEIMIKRLNYTEGSADELLRMLYSKDGYSLNKYKKDGKTKFIVNFAYSGKDGDDAFALVNLNKTKDNNYAKTLEIMSDETLSFNEKIKLIEENGYSAVLPFKEIEKFEIAPDENLYSDSLFEYTDIDGNNVNYSQNSVRIGDKDYRKMSQFHLSSYDNKSTELKDLDITLTDDATALAQTYRKTKRALFDNVNSIIEDTSLSERERLAKITKTFKRNNNHTISDMPGPTGYFALPTGDGKWVKTNVPTVADRTLSSQISVQPLELLVLQTAKKDLQVAQEIAAGTGHYNFRPNTEVLDALLKLSGKNYDAEKILDSMIAKAKKGEDINSQFNEFFYKHLLTPMNLEEGRFANNVNFSFMDYIEESLQKGYYSEKTSKTIEFLVSNKHRMSQLVKEKAAHDKKIYLLDSMKFNRFGEMSSPIRPVANQVQAGQPYILENVKKEMASVADKLQLTFGADILPIEEAEMRNAYANYKITGINEVYGDLETAVTANVKQMDSLELIGRMKDIEENFDEYFNVFYKNAVTSFNGLTEEQSRHLMQEALNIIKFNSINVYEDRAVARLSFGDNQFFKSPAIKTAKINPIEEAEYEVLLQRNNVLKDILKTGHIERNTRFDLGDRVITYQGASGRFTNTDEVKRFFTTGKGHLIEDTQGTRAVKAIFGINEKVTLNIPEYDLSHGYDRFRYLLGNTIPKSKAEEILKYLSEPIYDKLFGENVSIVTAASLYKHGSNDIIEGTPIDTIFYNLKKYSGDQDEALKEIQKIFKNADPNGYKIAKYNGRIVYSSKTVGNNGLVTQIRNVKDEIRKRANDDKDTYQTLWKNIIDDIDYKEKNQIYRTTVTLGYRTEATGGAMFTDPRAQLGFESKYIEEIDELVTEGPFDKITGFEKNGKKMTFQKFILESLREESINGMPDSSKTPISSLTGAKYKSAQKTVQGIHLATKYFETPEKLQNSNVILDLQLDEVNLIPSGTKTDELLEVGMYKIVGKNGDIYSNQLKALAGNKSLKDITALRITLPEGMNFNSLTKDNKGKSIKKVNQLLIPLYDLTPYNGEVMNTEIIRKINTTLETAKNYGKTAGITESQAALDKAVENLYKAFVADINPQNKTSYIYQNLLRLPMKNSRMLHGESSIAPVLNAMYDKQYKGQQHLNWYAIDDNAKGYRKEILTAIKAGDVKYNIDFAEASERYTVIKDGKLYYEDVAELSKEALADMGLDFKKTGRDLFYDIKYNDGNNYKMIIKEMNNGFFDDLTALTIIDKGINTDEVLRAAKSLEEYNALVKKLKNKDKMIKEYTKKYSGKGASVKALNEVNKIEHQLNLLNNNFETLAEHYLEKVGIFGMVGRWPTKDEGGTNIAVIKLAKHLAKEDIRTTPALTKRLHEDFDGDNPFLKLFLGDNGKILTKGNKKQETLLKALTKSFEYQVFKPYGEYASKTNKEMYDLVNESVEKIEKSLTREITVDGKKITIGSPVDYVTDMVDGKINTDRERVMIDSYLSDTNRKRILTELNLDNFKELEVKEYSDEVVHKVFNAWNTEYGNMLKNLGTLMAATKARINKNNIGPISNIAYKLNQVLLEVSTEALNKNDKIAKQEFNRIKTLLHVSTTGFLPEIEQNAIDVKHIKHGASTDEISKLNRGINLLFTGKETDIKSGQSLIRDAIKNKYKKPEEFEAQLEAFVKFSQNKKARALYGLMLPANIRDEIEENLKFRKQVDELEQYFLGNNMTSNIAFRANIQTLQELKATYNMGYYHNDIFQALGEGQVFIATEEGETVLYKTVKSQATKNGYMIDFDTLNLKDLKKNAQWKRTTITDSPLKIQALLQNKFGDYQGYNIAEILNNPRKFKIQINNETVTNKVLKFANMYAKGNTKMADKFLNDLRKDKTYYGKKTVNIINNFKGSVTEQQYEDFLNKIKFIKSNKDFQKRTKEGKLIFDANPSIAEDLLSDINKQIIERGKKTASPTNNIFDDALKQIANEFGISNLEAEDFINTQKMTSDIFKGYEDRVIDIQKARKDLFQFGDFKEEIDEILQSYRKKNNEYFKSLKINPITTNEIDDIFGWNSNDLGNMRVGIHTNNSLFGRRLKDLTEVDIDEILNYTNIQEDTLSQYTYNMTKTKVEQYIKDNKIATSTPLQGASDVHKQKIKDMNDELIRKAAEAGEGANAKGKKISKEYASELVQKTLQKGKEFAGTTPGKIAMGLAALGLVSNILSPSDNSSPLAPELNYKNNDGPINNSSLKAPSSNTGKKTVYADSNSGLEFKMSAKSKNKINQMNAAKQLAAQSGGETNVNIYDDRSQISSNWLERKFSELV